MTNLKTLTKTDLLIALDLLLILLALGLANYTNMDVAIQNHFFDFESETWLIDREEPVKKFIFYDFPKILFGIGVAVVLISTVLGFRKKSQFLYQNRHKFLLVLLGISLIPLTAGNVKKFTNIYCPDQVEIYGGPYPYVKILEHYSADFQQINKTKKGKCFPAGHAVTGFALFILCFVFERKLYKFLAFFFAALLGWVMGAYQMLKGAHFLSDTLVAMLLCFLIAAVISRFYSLIVYAAFAPTSAATPISAVTPALRRGPFSRQRL